MKKFATLLVVLALLTVAAPLSAQEPTHDLVGVISPEQSWILHPNEVWDLPLVADLKIASVEVSTKVEIEREEFVFTGEMAVPEDNPDIAGRRIKPLDGEIYIWTTVGEYGIYGWAPASGVAVVKTGPLGQGGPPPPGNVTPTPVPPEPTPTLEAPTPTPVPSTLTPEVKFALRGDDGHLLVTYDGGQVWEDLGEVQGAKGDQGPDGSEGPQGPEGPAGPGLSAKEVADTLKGDEGFLNSLRPETIVNNEALAGVLKADQAFADNLKGEKGDRGEHGPEGPPGPVGLTKRGLILLMVLACVGVIAALLSWWVNRPGPLSTRINEISEAMSEWTKALKARATSADLAELAEKTKAALRLHDEGFKAVERDRVQLEQGLQARVTKDNFDMLHTQVTDVLGPKPAIHKIVKTKRGKPPKEVENEVWTCWRCAQLVTMAVERGTCKKCGAAYTAPVNVAEDIQGIR